ncbi:MAG: GNAT family N-acetyltransferase [Anaerolineae bacterium]
MNKLLRDGLVLRQATKKDTDAVAKFNGRMHEEPGEEGKIIAWTVDLMCGKHPTTTAEEFLLVETDQREVVSSTCLIPQTWSYDGIEFPVGRPELVATDEKWRKKGLVREQFDALHEMSDRNGDLMQVITGIPWYYRQFGYSHALNLGGNRPFEWPSAGGTPTKLKEEKFSWRQATIEDIPSLQKFFEIHSSNYMLNSLRNAAIWKFDLAGISANSINEKTFWLISDQDGAPVGYVGFTHARSGVQIQEIACNPSQSMREFCLYITRTILSFVDQENAKNPKEKQLVRKLLFFLGTDHSAYHALGRQLGKQQKPYAWYIRIPDIPEFLRHVRPALEKRLADSVMTGHTGTHRITLYREHFALNFKDGSIISIDDYDKKQPQDGDTIFTRPEFIQLICGHRSFEEINHIHVDCSGNAEAWVLMNILFPKKASNPMGVN